MLFPDANEISLPTRPLDSGVDIVNDAPGADEAAMLLALERMRVNEALCARDVAVERLAEAYVSVRQKVATIERLQHEKDELQKQLATASSHPETVDPEAHSHLKDKKMVAAEIAGLAETFKKLQDEVSRLKDRKSSVHKEVHASGGDIENQAKVVKHDWEASLTKLMSLTNESNPFGLFRDISNVTPKPHSPDLALLPKMSLQDTPQTPLTDSGHPDIFAAPKDATTNTSPTASIEARHAILAALPLPLDVPADVLKPILIPLPFTLHEFLSTTPTALRAQLGNYRVFQESTTAWCPEREEHGYLLTPLYKCSTNPRVNTAHRWSCVDLSTKLNKPTECFYNKDGKWYYAGVYQAFRLDDLSAQEWETLSSETTQAIIKETLAGRKNTSPQNGYETGQLYAAGALRAACVGLQCIGFNHGLYRAILEHADKCAQTGKWRGTSVSGSGAAPLWTSSSPSSSPNMATLPAGTITANTSPVFERRDGGENADGVVPM